MSDKNQFDHRVPFHLADGRKARLVGLINKGSTDATKLVVAITQPNGLEFTADYPADGQCVNDRMCLVNYTFDEYHGTYDEAGTCNGGMEVSPGDHVYAAVSEYLPSIPPGSSPFHHDAYHMGTPLVRDWLIMHQGFGMPDRELPMEYMILCNLKSGQRIRIDLRTKMEVPTPSVES